MLAVRVQKTEKDQSQCGSAKDTVWFCKVRLLFSCVSKDDNGSKLHEYAYVSVLEEYKGRRRPGCVNRIKQVICIICIIYIMSIMFVRLAGVAGPGPSQWDHAL